MWINIYIYTYFLHEWISSALLSPDQWFPPARVHERNEYGTTLSSFCCPKPASPAPHTKQPCLTTQWFPIHNQAIPHSHNSVFSHSENNAVWQALEDEYEECHLAEAMVDHSVRQRLAFAWPAKDSINQTKTWTERLSKLSVTQLYYSHWQQAVQKFAWQNTHMTWFWILGCSTQWPLNNTEQLDWYAFNWFPALLFRGT